MVKKAKKNFEHSNLKANLGNIDDDFFSSFVSDDDNSYENERINEMIELEMELDDIIGNGIEEESVKIEKLNQKMQKLMTFDFDGKSENMLQKFTVEIDALIKKYVQLMEGIKKRYEKLSKFMSGLHSDNPIIIELNEQVSHFIFICSDFDILCKSYILELAHKKQNLKIFSLEERIKKLEIMINKQ
jgi:DNA repair ATPase RecN